ncbi:MAG: spermidine/putrescine ABC transporter substrate-binding protein [Flammeovirgaceae bacterium]|jgi:spermidine/putrescine transport system substrate-binding protein|nr:spermidine/putrescine ABC transporter substrate-binding protein [Flammeovirgaceae bacterium]
MKRLFNSPTFSVILFLGIVISAIVYFSRAHVFQFIQQTSESKTTQLITSDTLHFATWPEYFYPKFLSEIESDLDITIQLTLFHTNEELYDLIVSGKKFDVIMPTDYLVEKLVSEDIIKPFDHRLLSNYEKIDSRFKDLEYDYFNRYSIPYFWGVVGLMYNNNQVVNIPNNWPSAGDSTLLRSYINRFSILDDPRVSLGIALINLGYSPNTTNVDEIKQAANFLIKSLPIIGIVRSDGLQESFLNEDIYFGVNWSGSAGKLSSIQPNFRFLLPPKGSLFFVDNFAIPTTSRQDSLAYRLIDYLLNPRVAAKITNENYFANTVSDSRRYIDRMILKGPSYTNPFFSTNMYTIKELGETDIVYIQEWERFKIAYQTFKSANQFNSPEDNKDKMIIY